MDIRKQLFALYEQGHSHRQMKPLAEQVLQKYPEDETALLTLAVFYFKDGQCEEALLFAGRGLAASPDEPEVIRVCGGIESFCGDSELGLELCQKALAHRPDDVSTINSLLHALINCRHLDEALEVAKRGFAIDPDRPGWDYGFMRVYLFQQDWENAVQSSLAAIQKAPEEYSGKLGLGVACLNLGRLTEAEGAFVGCLQIRPNQSLAQRGLKVCVRRKTLHGKIRHFVFPRPFLYE